MDFRIRGLIELDSRVDAGVRSAIGSLDELSDVVLNQWWGLRNIADAFAAIGGAVAAGVGLAISEAVRWEDAMSEVERTTRSLSDYDWESEIRLEGIQEDLREIARSTPIAAGALAEIASAAGALGIAQNDVADFTKVVADLASVTDLTEDQAATLFARVSSLTGLPAEQYENLASAILEVGRSTAATEQQINTYATRLAAFLAPVGFTADEIIGLSGAMASLGIASERGSTAVQKTFFDMQTAVQEGGQELRDFAQIAGVSIQEFEQLLADDPSELLTRFVEGLSKVESSGISAAQVLSRLGIIEVRQVSTLQALAQAALNAAAPATQLRNVFQTSSDAFRENGALAQVTSSYYATLSRQIQITRNKLDELQAILGEVLIPFLRVVNTVLSTFLDGMLALPAPVRNAFAALVVLGGALAALTAAVFYIIPRIVLMRLSFTTLRSVADGTATGLAGVAAQAGNAAGQLQRTAGASAAATVGLAGVQGTSTAAAGGMSAAGATAGRLTGFLSKMGKALGTIGAILGVASIAITAYGIIAGRAEEETENLVDADLALVAILQDQTGALNANVAAWVRDQIVMSGASQLAQQLGIDIATLVSLITGVNATQETWDNFASSIENAGDKGAELLDFVKQQRLVFRASQEAAAATAGIIGDLTGEYDNLNESLADNKKAQQDALRAQEAQNEAILAYGDAVLAARSAQYAYNDALRDYNEAIEEASDPSDAISDAEWAITEARWAVEEATRAVEDAEKDLRTARADQQEDLVELQYDLADAQDAYLDSLDRVRDLEEELAELRGSGSIDDLRDATIRLQKAQAGLLRSNQSLADAQWYLNYLRAEGAGERDIREAELALLDAQVESAEAQDELIDSQQELDRIRDGASAEEIAQAERDLAKAIRDSHRAEQDMLQMEQELKQLRLDIANDTAYEEAQRRLEEQNRDLIEAERDLASAERDLQSLLDGELYDVVARAQLRLEEASYQLAKANTEVAKQTAIANGEIYSAGHEAQELARQLELIGANAPAAIRGNLSEIAGVLRRSIPTFGDIIDEELGELGDIGGGISGGLSDAIFDNIVEGLDDGLDRAGNESKTKFEQFTDLLRDQLPNVAATIGGIAGFAIGGPVGAVIGTGVGYILGEIQRRVADRVGDIGLVLNPILALALDGVARALNFENLGAAVEEGTRMLMPRIRDFLNIFRDFANGETGLVETVRKLKDNSAKLFREMTQGIREKLNWAAIQDKFNEITTKLRGWWEGIVSLHSSGQFLNASQGRDWAQAFGESIRSKISSFTSRVGDAAVGIWTSVTSRVGSYLGLSNGTSTKASGQSGSFMNGLRDGLTTKRDQVLGVAGGIVTSIRNKFAELGGAGLQNGKDAISGIYTGIVAKWNELASNFFAMKDIIADGIGNLYDTMKIKGQNIIVGLYNGVVSKVNEIFSRFQDIGRSIADAIGDFFDFGSPSKTTTKWGRWIVEGLENGISDNMRSLERQVGGMLSLFEQPDLGALSSQYRISGSMASPLAQKLGGGSSSNSTNITYEGDDITVNAHTNADPSQIASEIMWTKLVRTRG